MTKEERIKLIHEQMLGALREANSADTELAHIQADAALCEMLSALGYDDIVEEWHKIDKWYA